MGTAARPYFGPNHRLLAIAAVLCFLFGANEIVQRLLIEVDGTVIASQTSTGNRPATAYVVRHPDGSEQLYIAGPTDHSLPRRLPEGTRISKLKYHLAWKLNGRIVNDFPLYFYLGACGLGILLAYWALFQWRLNRPRDVNDGARHA